jgi:hypothetical protein
MPNSKVTEAKMEDRPEGDRPPAPESSPVIRIMTDPALTPAQRIAAYCKLRASGYELTAEDWAFFEGTVVVDELIAITLPSGEVCWGIKPADATTDPMDAVYPPLATAEEVLAALDREVG